MVISGISGANGTGGDASKGPRCRANARAAPSTNEGPSTRVALTAALNAKSAFIASMRCWREEGVVAVFAPSPGEVDFEDKRGLIAKRGGVLGASEEALEVEDGSLPLFREELFPFTQPLSLSLPCAREWPNPVVFEDFGDIALSAPLLERALGAGAFVAGSMSCSWLDAYGSGRPDEILIAITTPV